MGPRSNMGYLSWHNPMEGTASQRPSPSPTWGSRFVGARELGPRVAEPKLQGKTLFRGNPSPDMTYLPYLETFVSWPKPANIRQTGCIIIRESLEPQHVGLSLVFLLVQL